MSGNFVIYLIGYIIVIIGVAYGMSAAGLGEQWIIPAVLILAGLGIVYALSRSQQDKTTGQSTPQGTQHTTNVQSQPPQNQGQGTSSEKGETSTGGTGQGSSTQT